MIFLFEDLSILGIEPDAARLPRLAQKVNEGNALKIPDDFAQRIDAAWREDIKDLAALLPSRRKAGKIPVRSSEVN